MKKIGLLMRVLFSNFGQIGRKICRVNFSYQIQSLISPRVSLRTFESGKIECVAGVFDLCGHEIDTHSIKDGLCTGHGNGCNQSDQRIRTKLFIEIQKKSGSG